MKSYLFPMVWLIPIIGFRPLMSLGPLVLHFRPLYICLMWSLPRNRSKIPTYGLRLRIGSRTAQNGHHRNMYEARVLRWKFCSLSTPTWRYGTVHCLGMLRIKAFSMTGKLSCHSRFIVFFQAWYWSRNRSINLTCRKALSLDVNILFRYLQM